MQEGETAFCREGHRTAMHSARLPGGLMGFGVFYFSVARKTEDPWARLPKRHALRAVEDAWIRQRSDDVMDS